ncbi:uncharacterized protein KIAA0825-like [Tubulanus polymorphus]|uniref:uncharacterized protein KIAA0825-like n=1 Tax=Tubulanus polymorphus TaxID=672921 RepID=UPI003DA4A33C
MAAEYGLCLRTMLDDGIPSQEALDELIRKLDNQLNMNTKQLEMSVGDITQLATYFPGCKSHETTIEAFQFIRDNRVIEDTGCGEPVHEDINKMLRHVIQILDKQSPGCEEAILDHLLLLSSDEGMILPPISAESSGKTVSDSTLSINTVTDTEEEVTASLWAEIRSRLNRYFVERLKRLPLETGDFIVNHAPNKRLRYLQSLCSLYPSEVVWSRYRAIRAQQVDRCLGDLLVDSLGNEKSFSEISRTFERLTTVVIGMINEDFVLLNSDLFDAVKTFHALHEIYLEKISEKLTRIVDIARESLAEISEPKTLTPSKSEVGLLTSLKQSTSVLKQAQSKSLDSLLYRGQNDDYAQDDDTDVAGAFMKTLTNLTLSIFAIECHIDNLYRRMTWELLPGKPTDKKHLKSNLKESRAGVSPRRGIDSDDHMTNIFMRQDAMMHNMEDMDPIEDRPSSASGSLRVVEKSTHHDKPQWQWRSILGKLMAGIAKILEQIITDTATCALADELNCMEERNSVATEQICETMYGGKLDYPRFISRSVARLFRQLDRLLPLAAIGVDNVFHLLRSSFAECSMLQLKNCHLRLNKICVDATHRKLPYECSYIALASAAFIRNHLLHYDTVLSTEVDNGKKLFTLLYRQFCELVESISRQIVEHHNHVLSTCILQDAHAHDWNNLKDFYEGERCSFSVQMWNLHMKSLQHDLWFNGPPRLAQSMFSTVLHESLHVFAARLCRVKPSYRRTKQLQRDITTILLCTSQFLYPACNSVTRLLNCTKYDNIYYSIHNCCTTLLGVLAVVCSPLDVVYKVYKRGYLKKRTWENSDDPDAEEPPVGKPTDWLNSVLPNIYSKDVTDVDDLQTTTALYLQLKLLVDQPEPNWAMLLEALVMKDYTLSIMLLNTRIQPLISSVDSDSEEEVEFTSACGLLCCTGTSCQCRRETDIYNYFIPFVTVLMKLPMSPDAIVKVIIPVIEQSNDWSLFDVNCIPGRSVQVPSWLEAIYLALQPFIMRIIEPALLTLLSEEKPTVEPFWSHLGDLPCGCKPLHGSDSFRSNLRNQKVERDVIGDALQALVVQIVEDMYSLPGPLCLLFRTIQEKLVEKGMANVHKCVGLQVIGSCVRDILSNPGHISAMTGVEIRGQFQENLIMLSECSYFVISMLNKRREGNIPRRASDFFKKYRYWIADKLENVVQYLKKDLYTSEDSVLDGATANFREQYTISLSDIVLKSPEGSSSLVQIYNLVKNNIEWILKQFDVSSPLPDTAEPAGACFADFRPAILTSMNPLEHFDAIGSFKFDHEVIENLPIDWSKLVQSDLGMSEIGFRTLLFNRHEMHENAVLEENEKKPVQNLHAMYDPDSTDA